MKIPDLSLTPCLANACEKHTMCLKRNWRWKIIANLTADVVNSRNTLPLFNHTPISIHKRIKTLLI